MTTLIGGLPVEPDGMVEVITDPAHSDRTAEFTAFMVEAEPLLGRMAWLLSGDVHRAEVRIGLIDIDCKESTDLRQRLADVDAVLQQAYLDSAPGLQEAHRATVDAALAASREYLAAADITMP